MNTILCRIRTAARSLLLLIILGYSAEGMSQINFEVREEVPVGPGNHHLIKGHPADVDGDGDLDLLISGFRRNVSLYRTTELYLNEGDAKFTLVPEPFDNCDAAAIADVDGDQDQDVLIYGKCEEVGMSCKLYLNDGTGNFTPVFEDQFPGVISSNAEFFHYDNDGLPDLFISGSHSGTWIANTYRNLGNGKFAEIPELVITPKMNSTSVEIGDIDLDGDMDVIFSGKRNRDYHGTSVHLNNSGVFSKPIMINDLADGDMKLRDFNKDGNLDLLVFGDNTLGRFGAEYYLNDGNGNFGLAAEQVFFPSSYPRLEAEDLDGDGDLDIFVGGRDTFENQNGNVIYLNDGSGNFTLSNEFRNIGTGGTAVGNFDGQGLPDIMLYGNMDAFQGPIKHLIYLNRTVVNEVPTASEVSIAGEVLVGKQLTGSYYFLDPEGAADQSILRWYRANDVAGTEKMEIEEATSSTYILGEADLEKFIVFEVVPFDGIKTGEAVKSAWVGPILMPSPKIVLKGNNIILDKEASASLENHTHFGNVSVRSEIQRNFAIENIGTGDLIISSITVSGTNAGDFVVMEQENLTIVPGDSRVFTIAFSPSGSGERTAEISIENNDGENNLFTFKVAGEGLNSAPEFTSPSEVAFTENETGIVVDINASNGDGGAEDMDLSYSITGGEDKDLFNVDPTNGNLTFKARPDFEAPSDSNNDNIYLVEITANDGQAVNNNSVQKISVSVTNLDEPPTAICVANFTVNLDANGSASITAEDINNHSTDDIEIAEITIIPFQFNCADVGTKEVILLVKDTGGNTSSCTTTVNVVDNQKPEITGVSAITETSGPEGCGAFINIDPPTIIDNCNGPVLTGIREDGKGLNEVFPVGETKITWTATTANNQASESFIQTVTVINNAPENIVFTGPDGPRQVGTPISMKCSFTDENITSVTWKAFNGNQVVEEYSTAATGSEASYTFEDLPAGVYTVILELRDHCGKIATGYSDYVVLYDPNGGFVTGGGWFDSPLGAMNGSEITGKAHFGFNAKYKNGNTDVTGEVGGNTSFQFKAGNLDFKSFSHEKMSLVVSGGFKATYKGQGSVNGMGDHNFMVTVIDAEETSNHLTDLFRIKIWNSQGVLYDNMLNAEENADPSTAIGGGSIVIHKPKSSSSGKTPISLEEKELAEELEIFTAYPNPMEESAYITFKLNRSTGATLNLYDLHGREISRMFQGEVQQGQEYEIEVRKNGLMKGVYIYRLVLNSGQVYQKQLLVN